MWLNDSSMATKQNIPAGVRPAPKPETKRKVGRPAGSRASKGQKSTDMTVGREMLIDVTCNLLKTTQPATITRALVARETGVDPSLIRYYFRNRSALLAAAARRITERYGEMMRAAEARSDGSPVSLLRERIGTLIDLLAAYPFFHRLLTEEIMPSQEPEAREMFSAVTERGTMSYDAILAAGIEQGVFDPAIDRTMLFTAVIGMSEFYMPGLRVMEEAEGRTRPETETRADYKDFVCNLILNGIVKR
jgi:TetR/AcrR family transcriptional regulator